MWPVLWKGIAAVVAVVAVVAKVATVTAFILWHARVELLEGAVIAGWVVQHRLCRGRFHRVGEGGAHGRRQAMAGP